MNSAKTFSINRNEENEQIHYIEREQFSILERVKRA